uniref:Si:dkey-17e16.9 n=1 Tax=Hippocampus comes TaxID=109280 RepID=A0A3Q2Z8E5_HIPCM
TVKTGAPLGKLLLLKIEKDPRFWRKDDEWFCSKIAVTTPEGETLLFPCYQWLSNDEVVELRGGKGLVDNSIKTHDPFFSEFTDTEELKFKGIVSSKDLLMSSFPAPSEYLFEHWKDDDFYGYQFLNGVNPHLIKRCYELPPNFPVTEEMVKPYLEIGMPLHNEFKRGNMFLYDQKILSGIPGRLYHGERLPLPAPLCLLYLNPEKKLIPIAIQVHQQPSEDNPIFLPSDSETDWLLAKIMVKNADMMTHQAISHLKNTHLISESWAMSLFRNFPLIHPIYKLLIPHFRWILHVNALARETLLGPSGSFKMVSLGLDGTIELMRRAQDELTYSSLCIPDDIRARGLESIPDFYYRDDGLKLWDIIHRFVNSVVGHFYRSNDEVVKDSELQGWIHEIFTHCFLGSKRLGCPEAFHCVEEVVKFITMVIFTVSVQHAAVNNGQVKRLKSDSKSLSGSTEETSCKSKPKVFFFDILLSAVNVSGSSVISGFEYFRNLKRLCLFLQYRQVLLGSYPDERFQEPEIKQMMEGFQAGLSSLSDDIKARNSKLGVPYTYLDPSQIDSSIIK